MDPTCIRHLASAAAGGTLASRTAAIVLAVLLHPAPGVGAAAHGVAGPDDGDRPAARAALAARVAGPGDTAVATVGLEEAVALFRERGVELRLARAEARSAAGAARQEAAYPNPAFSLLREDLTRNASDYRETTFSLQQTLEWPGRTLALGRASDRSVRAARARFRSDSLRLVHRVRLAYLRTAEAEGRLEALREVARVVREAAAAGEVRRAEGDISGYELRRLRLERARLEQRLAAARIERDAARRELAGLVLPGSDTVALGTRGLPEGPPPEVSRAAALAAALERPAVEAGRRALEASEARASAARLERIPDLRLTGGYKTQTDDFDGPVLGLSLSLPLLDRRGGAVQAAEARREAAEARLRLERRAARNEVLRALDRYRSVRRRTRTVGGELLAPSEDLLEIARTAYEAGEMELVGLLDGADAYRDARTTALRLRAELWGTYWDLRRAMGGSSGHDLRKEKYENGEER